MAEKRVGWWAILKMALGVGIVGLVAWHLYRDVSRLPPRTEPIRYGWLVLSAILYLIGLGLSGVFWLRLLGHMKAAPPWLQGIRAYYLSQLGKYAPGKALALIMRVTMVHRPETPRAIAALAAFYEVLTTMTVGVLLALPLIALVHPKQTQGLDWSALLSWDVSASHDPSRGEVTLLSLTLLAVTALPLTPWLFNRLARGVTRPFGMATPPAVTYAYLGEGVVLLTPCWLLFGLALACGCAALPEISMPWTLENLARLILVIAVAYVGGFVIPAPGGLGGREYLLLLLLLPMLQGERPTASLVVLLLRLAWTLGEVVCAGVLYFVPVAPTQPGGTT